MARRQDSEYQKGYVDGQGSGSNTLLSFIVGLLIAVVLGGAAWFTLGQANQSSQGDTDIINVPAPEAPEAPEAPDVNINVPQPEINVPDVELPKPEVNVPDVELPTSTEEAEGQE